MKVQEDKDGSGSEQQEVIRGWEVKGGGGVMAIKYCDISLIAFHGEAAEAIKDWKVPQSMV